jgi:hypothetical protein
MLHGSCSTCSHAVSPRYPGGGHSPPLACPVMGHGFLKEASRCVIETSPDLRLHSPVAVPRPALLPPRVQRLVGTVPCSAARGTPRNSLREDGRQDHDHRALDPLVRAAGLASWPLLPPCLLEPSPFDRRRDLPLGTAPRMPVTAGVVQVFGVLLGRPLVPPWRTVLPGEPRGCQKKLPVTHVQHGVAHPRRRAVCRLRHPLECPGDGGCARRLFQRSLQNNVMPGLAVPPVGPWDPGAPPSRPRTPGSRPAVRCSAQTAKSPSRGRAVCPLRPRDPASLLFLCAPVRRTGSCERRECPLHAGSRPLRSARLPRM